MKTLQIIDEIGLLLYSYLSKKIQDDPYWNNFRSFICNLIIKGIINLTDLCTTRLLLDKFFKKGSICLEHFTYQTLALTSIIIAEKMNNDKQYSMGLYARIADEDYLRFNKSSLCRRELDFLVIMDFDVFISPTEINTKYLSVLGSHNDI